MSLKGTKVSLIMDKKRENELYYSQIMSKPNYKSSSLQSRNQNKRVNPKTLSLVWTIEKCKLNKEIKFL